MTTRSIQRGVPNYVTPVGLEMLLSQQSELERKRKQLKSASGDAEDIKRRLSALTRRWSMVNERISTAVLVTPYRRRRNHVAFGAIVTFRVLEGIDSGAEQKVQITGVDQAEQQPRCLAFSSPLARAMMGMQAGATVTVKGSGDIAQVKILSVDHPEVENPFVQ